MSVPSKKVLQFQSAAVRVLWLAAAWGALSGADKDLHGQQLSNVIKTLVFRSGADGYHTYRIPAIVTAHNGDLLAFAEGRKRGSGDDGDIDIVMKRSSDGGRHWSGMSIVQDEWSDPAADVTIGNPSPVVDLADPEHPGRIWLPFTRNNDRVFVTCSDDHGASWLPRVEITAAAKQPRWGWYATGPGHGIQLQRGTHAGRIIIPADHRLAGEDSWGAHVLLSDDHGVTWKIGGVDTHLAGSPIHPNETTAVELIDGRVYFNARDQNGSSPGTRLIAYSEDGGLTFSAPFSPEEDIVAPVVQNSVLRLAATDQGDRQNILMYSAPGAMAARRDLTVLVSSQEGGAWTKVGLLHPGPAAYSDLTRIDARRTGVLYEAGVPLYSEIIFASFELSDLPLER
ncbi:MAG: exo-alpha-sialidase [Pirellulales bacterium]|nr:exo-alpha-sialidase [Pirellulales bacterium]